MLTFTTGRIAAGIDPITYVSHNSDGAWQFHHPVEGKSPSMRDAALVALKEIVKLDPSIAELADLPEGWCAERDAPGLPWRREPEPD